MTPRFDIVMDFENEKSSLPTLHQCAMEAREILEKQFDAQSNGKGLSIVLTNKLARANAVPCPGELVFFISDFRAIQRKVTESATVVVHDALPYLTRVIVASTCSHLKKPVSAGLESFVD